MASVDIINLALRKIGASDALSSAQLSADSVPNAKVANDLYSTVLDDLLRAYPWNFATKRAKLAPSATEPAFEFKYQYRLPSDFLRIISVSGNSANSGDTRYKIETGDEDTVEGTFGKTNSGVQAVGDGVTNGKNFAIKFTNTTAGAVSGMRLDVANINAAFSCLAKIYSNSSGSPGTQVGGNSTAVTLAQGINSFVWASSAPILDGETVYWAVFTDNTATTGDVDLRVCASDSSFGSGIHDTITSITDSLDTEFRVEVSVSQGSSARFILTDVNELYLRYVAQVTDTSLMPADFQETLAYALAAQFAIAIAQSQTMMERMTETYHRRLARARSVDAMEDYPEQFPDGTWITGRFRTWDDRH